MALKSAIQRKTKTSSRPNTPRTRKMSRGKTQNAGKVLSARPGISATTGIKHRPSNSYGGQFGPDKLTSILRDDYMRLFPRPAKPSSKRSTPRAPGQKKIIQKNNENKRVITRHRRAASLADNTNLQQKPPTQPSHLRKLSLGGEQSVIGKVAHKTKGGFIPGNPNKVNQDSFIEITQLNGHSDISLFGILDGHGFYGREVSQYAKQRLPEFIGSDPYLKSDPKKVLTVATLKCDEELTMQPFDVNFSGSTMNLVLIQGKKLWCANAGDSRSLVARQLPDKNKPENSGRHWMSIALSRDHKPDEKDEQARISAQGGRIQAYQDEEGNPMGPARVWLMHQDVPGLAMSRSLGDAVAGSVGVIAEPEVLEFQLTPEDKFMVLASDGVFEFITNEEIVKIVVPYWRLQDPMGACEALVKESHMRWTTEEEVIDDITCVVVFLNVC